MVTFFRKIRRGLIANSKSIKYLKYAIGEIVLVVIGILIALGINNWNESRKLFDDELKLYSKLLTDLNESYSNTLKQIEKLEKYQDVHYHVYNESKGRASYDSILDYNKLLWIENYNMDIEEKYSSSIVNLTNEKIRDLIKRYIRNEKVTQNAYDVFNEMKLQRLRPFFRKYGIHNVEPAFNDQPYFFDSLFEMDLIEHSKLEEQYGTTELDELLFELRYQTSWVYTTLNRLKESNKEFVLALKNELELYHIATSQKKKE
jgi:hypothetical protein